MPRPRAQADRVRLILDIAFEPAAGANTGHGWGLEDEHEGVLDCAHLLAEIAQDAVFGQACRDALLKWGEADEDHAGVRSVGKRWRRRSRRRRQLP